MLLETRSKRELQSVDFGMIQHTKVAALAAELVSTDRQKPWTYRGVFGESAAAAFCTSVRAHTASGVASSLTELVVVTTPSHQTLFARLLLNSPALTKYVVLTVMLHSLSVLCAECRAQLTAEHMFWCVCV